MSSELVCKGNAGTNAFQSYRQGRCQGCGPCPANWSNVELYSEHYRCAERNGLTITRHSMDLGDVKIGDPIQARLEGVPAALGGFMQAPTLARLPPGVRFSDEGTLAGQVRFDPHRRSTYRVDFVAVSTAAWDNPDVGLVRLEVSFVVKDNLPPEGFDVHGFNRAQDKARAAANLALVDLGDAWDRWEQGEQGNRDTCDQMYAALHKLRDVLDQHPRLDGGRWWALLGGYHMNVHKLLENVLFECELYLGHALTFGETAVRQMAEQNLAGCYQKRLLESARFMWMEGIQQMMHGEWAAAVETLRTAAAKKEGWGWAVNHGDIWLAEAAARLILGAERTVSGDDGANAPSTGASVPDWVADAVVLVNKCHERSRASGFFGAPGAGDSHPWALELDAAVDTFIQLQKQGSVGPGGPDTQDLKAWTADLKARTLFWCGQVLSGAPPFPPRVKPRPEDAETLARRLPGHNA